VHRPALPPPLFPLAATFPFFSDFNESPPASCSPRDLRLSPSSPRHRHPSSQPVLEGSFCCAATPLLLLGAASYNTTLSNALRLLLPTRVENGLRVAIQPAVAILKLGLRNFDSVRGGPGGNARSVGRRPGNRIAHAIDLATYISRRCAIYTGTGFRIRRSAPSWVLWLPRRDFASVERERGAISGCATISSRPRSRRPQFTRINICLCLPVWPRDPSHLRYPHLIELISVSSCGKSQASIFNS
jgi:hypothetical protein